jgi:ABC-type Fe3+-hydroxamate transport system substrate-binding protein
MNLMDQMGRNVEIPNFPPRRIISLVPSQTELLHALGLEEQVVGITKFCTHPKAWFQSKKHVGGTKTFNFPVIEALNPDLIIGNKEENEQAQILALMRQYPVWMSDITHLEDALAMIRDIGTITNTAAKAEKIALNIQTAFVQLALHPPNRKVRTAYFIWRKPYMVAGAGTFIHEMMEKAGFENIFGHLQRYPEIRLEQLADQKPDLILLSSEPYPFSQKHFPVLKEICPQATILLVDGTLFSWYGSRLLDAPAYFTQLQQTLHIDRN